MPSVFISYSHDPADPAHGERVAGLAAALLRDGFEVFFDQNRNGEEETVPWPIWMDGKIEQADFVVLVCTELYLKKIQQKVGADEGLGVCWEANLIYNWLYEAKLNTAKFIPIIFLDKHRNFIPRPLRGASNSFVLDADGAYRRFCAFLTGQHRAQFPDQGKVLPQFKARKVSPLFAPADASATPVAVRVKRAKNTPKPRSLGLKLKADKVPEPRRDIRGLDWYEECDAGHFLGREEDANRILAMLLSHPIIRLTGPSGVGKSSLIRAGLLPKIREFGWRACVIRPFDDPARRMPDQLALELLEGNQKFTVPLDPAKLREELAALLTSAGVSRLVLLVDQFEDIVSPMAAASAVETMRGLLVDFWNQREARPLLRAVLVYRTDAEARLGRLWQEVNGRLDGLPYHSLEGLSSATAEKILEQTAAERGWKLDVGLPDIVRQLANESRKMDCVGDVFPVYLQIFQKQAAACPDGRITAAFIETLGGVSGLIGKYLEQSLAKLQARGGDWQRCGAILESLSRATGSKTALSLSDLARETRLSGAALAEMLVVLVNERLVRPVGHEIYEIQHDRLAAAIIENMKEGDRDAKTARDFLAAKVPVFEKARTPLASGDLIYLYKHRYQIHPSESELRIILASLCSLLAKDMDEEKPMIGWFWFYEANEAQWWERLLQIQRWAEEERSAISVRNLWGGRLPLKTFHPNLAKLAKDICTGVRCIVAWTIAKDPAKNSGLMAILVQDKDSDVRQAVAEALAKIPSADALPLLNQLARDKDWGVRRSIAGALAKIPPADALPLLGQLARDTDSEVRLAIAGALAKIPPAEALPLLSQLALDKDSDVRQAVAVALAVAVAVPKIPSGAALPLVNQLASDKVLGVRQSIAGALAKIPPADALPLLSQLTRDGYSDMRQAVAGVLARIPPVDALPLLNQLARDMDSDVRQAVAVALAKIPPADALPLLNQLASDKVLGVRQAMAGALANIPPADALPLLNQLAHDGYSGVRRAVAGALANIPPAGALPLLNQLALDEDSDVRQAVAGALANIPPADALPLLNQLALDKVLGVRRAMAVALASIPPADALSLLNRLVQDEDSDVRQAAAVAVANIPAADALPLLSQLVQDEDSNVRHVAAKAMIKVAPEEVPSLIREWILSRHSMDANEIISMLSQVLSRKALEEFLEQYEANMPPDMIAALDAALYMPEWLREKAEAVD